MEEKDFSIKIQIPFEGYSEAVETLKEKMSIFGLEYDENKNCFQNFEVLKGTLKEKDPDYSLAFKDDKSSIMNMITYQLLKISRMTKAINNIKGSMVIGKTDKEINTYLAERGWFLSTEIDLDYIKEYIGGSNNKDKKIDINFINEMFEDFF